MAGKVWIVLAALCWGQGEGGELLLHPAGAFTAISVGRRHVCGLRPDGAVWCWLRTLMAGPTRPRAAVRSMGGNADTCPRDDTTAQC